MVYESFPWKEDLKRRRRLISKYNTIECFDKNEESAYTVIEKAVFYSAFIIRKLIDCGGKVSDDADKYALNVLYIKPKEEINLLNRFPDEDNFDWDNEKSITKQAKKVCDWLIHSYIFFFSYSEERIINGFYVSLDYDRNEYLYHISLNDWIDYMDFIANDYVVSTSSHYDYKKKDYVYIRKERGYIELIGEAE